METRDRLSQIKPQESQESQAREPLRVDNVVAALSRLDSQGSISESELGEFAVFCREKYFHELQLRYRRVRTPNIIIEKCLNTKNAAAFVSAYIRELNTAFNTPDPTPWPEYLGEDTRPTGPVENVYDALREKSCFKEMFRGLEDIFNILEEEDISAPNCAPYFFQTEKEQDDFYEEIENIDLVRSDKTEDFLKTCKMVALVLLGEKRAVEWFKEGLINARSSDYLRMRSPLEKRLQAFVEVSTGGNVETRKTCTRALKTITRHCDDIAGELYQIAYSGNKRVKFEALHALARLNGEGAMEIFSETLNAVPDASHHWNIGEVRRDNYPNQIKAIKAAALYNHPEMDALLEQLVENPNKLRVYSSQNSKLDHLDPLLKTLHKRHGIEAIQKIIQDRGEKVLAEFDELLKESPTRSPLRGCGSGHEGGDKYARICLIFSASRYLLNELVELDDTTIKALVYQEVFMSFLRGETIEKLALVNSYQEDFQIEKIINKIKRSDDKGLFLERIKRFGDKKMEALSDSGEPDLILDTLLNNRSGIARRFFENRFQGLDRQQREQEILKLINACKNNRLFLRDSHQSAEEYCLDLQMMHARLSIKSAS